jgi:hypothetical protein
MKRKSTKSIVAYPFLSGCANEDPGISEEAMPLYIEEYCQKTNLLLKIKMKVEIFSFCLQVKISPFLVNFRRFLIRAGMKA